MNNDNWNQSVLNMIDIAERSSRIQKDIDDLNDNLVKTIFTEMEEYLSFKSAHTCTSRKRYKQAKPLLDKRSK